VDYLFYVFNAGCVVRLR